MEHSWVICGSCDALQPRALELADLVATQAQKNVTRRCRFCEAKHVVPAPDDVPAVLVGLRRAQLVALRPMSLRQGARIQDKGCLPRHGGQTWLYWAEQHVTEQISTLPDDLQPRAWDAYEFLRSEPASAYDAWVRKLEEKLRGGNGGRSLGALALLQPFVECALFPDLYPFRSWCESVCHGKGARHRSAKQAFLAKLCGPLVDYALDYELIQFQFDRWVLAYFTSRSAVRQDVPLKWLLRQFPDSPQKNYTTKLQIIDMHRQHGAASFFITVAPGIFALPLPPVAQQPRELGRVKILGCNALECLHVSHMLEQLCIAYVLHRDARSARSPYGVFRGGRKENPILGALVKFEYQDGAQAREGYHGTGMRHAHILVWSQQPERTAFLQWMCSTSGTWPKSAATRPKTCRGWRKIGSKAAAAL